MDIRRIRLLFSKFQNIVDEEISLMDNNGYIIDSTNLEKIGEYDAVLKYEDINRGITSIEDRLYSLIDTDYGNNLIISIKGTSTENHKLLQIIGLFLSENLNSLTKEDFFKGIILKEFDRCEIKDLCNKFNIKYDSTAQVVVIKLSEDVIGDSESIITNMYQDEILIRLNNNTLAFIKLTNNDDEHDEIGQGIYDTIFSELLYEPRIGVGIIAENLSLLHESYEKANILIKLGEIFSQNKKIYYYNDLLLPILIDNVDASKLKDILGFANCGIEGILMDKELLLTATQFLENNLNISDTARKLYVHRNTLIYRLNKIQNITGLDLRSFNDAVNFNILASGVKYLHEKSL